MKPIRSIGIILDGNRRWAKARGLPSFEGHRQGYETLKRLWEEFPRLKKAYGLEYITLYAFSTENWKRSAPEVEFLMQLFGTAFQEILSSLLKGLPEEKQVRIRIAGQKDRFSPQLQELIKEVEEKTKDFKAGTICIGLSYGGRAEILNAVSSLLKDGVQEVTEEEIGKRLWTAGIPEPDLIIRTSGEMRLSNFLPWQGVYSELFFTNTLWPDFSVTELEKIFEEFRERDRRHGA
jgi:undecaprenyl diphosphate synthase